MTRVFLSYSTADRTLAEELCKQVPDVLGEGIHVFMGQPARDVATAETPPGNWLASVASELQASDIVVGLVTEQSIHSRWFLMEVGGAILFGKTVLPLCVSPCDPARMPAPLDAQNAYLASYEGMTSFFAALARLAQRSPKLDHVRALADLDKERQLVDEARRNPGLLLDLAQTNRSLFAALHDYYGTYRATLDTEVDIRCDPRGNCTLERIERIEAETVMFHTYYDVNIDRPGSIDISASSEGAPLRALSVLGTPIHKHMVVLFPRILLPGDRCTIHYTVRAENYMADLIADGREQLTYRRNSSLRVRNSRYTLRFPREKPFLQLALRLVDGPHGAPVGQIMLSEDDGSDFVFRFELPDANGESATDVIELSTGLR